MEDDGLEEIYREALVRLRELASSYSRTPEESLEMFGKSVRRLGESRKRLDSIPSSVLFQYDLKCEN